MATAPDTAAPALPIVPSDEEQMLRETVRQICAGFGPDYTRRKVAEDEPPRELWDALASRGFLGVNLPEEYGGGGLGMSRARRGRRGDLGERLLAAADRGLPRDRRQHPRPARQRGAEGPLAARHRGRHDEDRVRDHGARRGLQLAQHLDLGAARQRQLRAARGEDLHLGRRGLRRDPGRRRGRATTTATSACRCCSSSTPTRPGSSASTSRPRCARPTSSGRCSSTTSRCRRTG